jgi:integrase
MMRVASVRKMCQCQVKAKCAHDWVVKYRDPAGKQRQQGGFRLKAEATSFGVKAEDARRKDVYLKTDATTFGEYARQCVRLLIASPGTRQRYLGIVSNHLGALDGRKLADVARDRDGIRKLLLETLPAKGLSRASVEVVKVVITSTLNEAVRAGKISSHNAGAIRLPAVTKAATFTVPTKRQVELLADGLPKNLALSVWLAYGCGLRLSEALGVRADDFHDDTLILARQITSGTATGPLKARKADESRDIPVPAYVAQRVREHAADHGTGDGYLFHGKVGAFVSESSFQVTWNAARIAAGMPGFRFHDLRHSYASFLLGNGVDLPSVSRWLGHKDVGITARVYSHSLPKTFDKARQLLDSAWGAE